MTALANSLAEELDELQDRYDAITLTLARIESANDEFIPGVFIDRLSRGEHPVAVWRDYRELDVDGLAADSGVAVPVIEAIEAGEADPSFTTMTALARTLRVDLDDLVPWSQE